ncbi:hypothetical protein FNV43_RR22867 [Rhamnella rubrinervis]|uniref:RRM domain-containing protein n=1 Tax=Rhamnella rubrinervis TaxID=2594499 RepID=A0A8K0GVJ1_9ROSA|nr:hypothetical protein FNV43_RR22867 [Rhamnella rubrinervis]
MAEVGGRKVLNPEAAEFFVEKTQVFLPQHFYPPPPDHPGPALSSPLFCYTTHSAYFQSFSFTSYGCSPVEPFLFAPQGQYHIHSPVTTTKSTSQYEEPKADTSKNLVVSRRVRSPTVLCMNRCLSASRKFGGEEVRGRCQTRRFRERQSRHAWKGKVDDNGTKHCGRNVGITSSNYYYAQNVKAWSVAKNKSEILPVKRDGNITTVMIRNIPSKYTRQMLMNFLDQHCMMENGKVAGQKTDAGDHQGRQNQLSAFDFLYLPMDFKSGMNKGYAFVNFTEPEAAWKFYNATNSQTWKHFKSTKIREIARARLQGKEELVGHFEKVTFPCGSEEVLPLCFSPARDGSEKSVKQSAVGRFISGNGRGSVDDKKKGLQQAVGYAPAKLEDSFKRALSQVGAKVTVIKDDEDDDSTIWSCPEYLIRMDPQSYTNFFSKRINALKLSFRRCVLIADDHERVDKIKSDLGSKRHLRRDILKSINGTGLRATSFPYSRSWPCMHAVLKCICILALQLVLTTTSEQQAVVDVLPLEFIKSTEHLDEVVEFLHRCPIEVLMLGCTSVCMHAI